MGSEGHSSSVDVESSKEWKKVEFLRNVVEEKDPQAKEVDNFLLRRFLRARDSDVNKASTLLLKYLKWRRDFVPNGFILDSQVQNELAGKKMFMQGFDKLGCPIGVAFAAKFNAKHGMNEFKSFVVYLLDKFCSRAQRGQEKFTCIADLQGWGYSNCNIRAYLAAIDILQSYYPERLNKVFLIHVPYLFMKAWKVIYPFIDEKTKKKFVFCEDKELKATLLEEMDESQLPEIYGGKMKLVPIEATEE